MQEQNGGVNDKGQRYLNRIASEAQRMGYMLDDLLQLIRLNRTPIRRSAVDLSRVFSSVVQEMCKHKAMDRATESVIQPGLFANCDISLMQIVFHELLENACKFTAGQSMARVEFGAQDIDGERVFFIRDNGIGFDMAYAHRMFRNFEQLTGPGEAEGTGMGLATVQRIIQRHGGRVWIEGKPEEGATVFFTLPET